MGYRITLDGEFTVTPSLSAADVKWLADFNDARHDSNTMPAYYCPWVADDDTLALIPDGSECPYSFDDWLQWLLDNFFKPRGYTVEGQVEWDGEEPGDSGVLFAHDGKVEAIHNLIFNPGPSWARIEFPAEYSHKESAQ